MKETPATPVTLPPATVGEAIRFYRGRAGLSAKELAAQVRCVPHTIGAWEADRTVPRDRDLVHVADALGVDPDVLSPGLRNRCTAHELEAVGS